MSIGGVIAICAFLGFSDLHRENIFWGINKKTQDFVFGPIDIECVLEDYHLLSQTRLIPTYDIELIDCGLSVFKAYLYEYSIDHFIPHIIEGFILTIFSLKKNEGEIIKALENMERNSSPIKSRVLLKATRQYYKYLRSIDLQNDDILSSELEQLKRGDIPYFFRCLNQNLEKIYYFDKDNNTIECEVSKDIARVINSNLRAPNQHKFRARKSHELAKYGALQLGKYLSDKKNRNSYEFLSNHNKIKINKDFIYIENKYFSVISNL